MVVGTEDMERIISESFWSNLRENWLMRLNSFLVPAFMDKFWKLVMYCWNLLLVELSFFLKDLCLSAQS